MRALLRSELIKLRTTRTLYALAGVTIGGGLFDSSTDIRFKENNSFDSRSRFLFTDLRITEPPDVRG